MSKKHIIRISRNAFALIFIIGFLGFAFSNKEQTNLAENNSQIDSFALSSDSTKWMPTLTDAQVDSINLALDFKQRLIKDSLTGHSNSNQSQLSERLDNIESKTLTGLASYYHDKFDGRRTANGETFSQAKFTCACNKLPLNTYVRIQDLDNGKEVIVKVNDRLAKHNHRIVDLSKVAAKKLGSVQKGITHVKVTVLPSDLAQQIINQY